MGGDTLVTRIAGEVIDEDHINLFNRVLEGAVVGRDSSGAPTASQDLGTASIPWGTIRATNFILGGLPIDPELITAPLNRIISGAIRVTSDFPDYLRPAGTGNGNSFTLLATAVPLSFDVNGTDAQFIVDTVKSALTVAPSPPNNTCVVNDSGLTGQDTSKNLGENDTIIPVDAMGSILTLRIGQFVALLNQTTNEIMICRIESTTQLVEAFRGFFFDSLGSPIQRAVLNNNDVLQILSFGFIFVDQDGVTIDVTFRNPVFGGNQPTSPLEGDYWYDTAVTVWKRFSGVSFDQINRTFAGFVVIDTADCIGVRPSFFDKTFSDDNTLVVDLLTVDSIKSHQTSFLISVNAELFNFNFKAFEWLAATDFESGVTRTINRNYWLYITEDGRPQISDKKPYDLLGILKGWYHPYESWRAVGQIFNNASDEFELLNESDKTLLSLDGVVFSTGRNILSNNLLLPNDQIDFSGGLFAFDDGRGQGIAPAFTKLLGSAFAPGNDAGMMDTAAVKVPDSTYNLFTINNPLTGAIDYLASLSFSNPALPFGFSKKRFIGSILTDSAANIRLFQQLNKTFILQNNVFSFFLNGTFPLARTLATVTAPTGRSTIAILPVHTFRGVAAAAELAFRFTNPDNVDQLAVIGAAAIFDVYNQNQSSNTAHGTAIVECPTNSSSQIGIRPSTAANVTFRMDTRGWIDPDLE